MLPAIVLQTSRLLIRPFVREDLGAIHPILNACFGEQPIEERREWIEWSVRNELALRQLYQPPYGDRAVVLRATGAVIGSVGVVPSYGPFDALPYFRQQIAAEIAQATESEALRRPEMGLFWAIGPAQQRQRYASEAASALAEYMFGEWHLRRLVATTEDDNVASIAVMRRLGMRIERNPQPTPEWFQIVGILDHPRLRQALDRHDRT